MPTSTMQLVEQLYVAKPKLKPSLFFQLRGIAGITMTETAPASNDSERWCTQRFGPVLARKHWANV